MKKVIPVVATTVLAMGVVFSGPAYAAPQEDAKSVVNNNGKENKKDQERKQENKKEDKKEDKKPSQGKGQTQQLKSVDKQLDKIEEQLHHYQTKVSHIAVATSDSAEVKEPVVTNDSAEVEESTVTGDSTTVVTSDSTYIEEDADQPTDDEIEEQVGEVEHELQDNPGYAGKLHALQNRLAAVTKQLDALSAKGFDPERLQVYYDRITALHVKIDGVLATIGQVQTKIQEKIKTDDRIEEKAPVVEKSPVKPWYIKFNKKLDAQTLSNLDIVVLDQNQNLVETTFTYSESDKTITVSPLQQYKLGETYTLFIGKEISDTNGKSLKNAIKMNFSIK